jgi:dihydrolipoamide dehydrogenase
LFELGCIPTKALLKSAQIYKYATHAVDFGISINGSVTPDFDAVVKRSRMVADTMSKGVQFLLKKIRSMLFPVLEKLLKIIK